MQLGVPCRPCSVYQCSQTIASAQPVREMYKTLTATILDHHYMTELSQHHASPVASGCAHGALDFCGSLPTVAILPPQSLLLQLLSPECRRLTSLRASDALQPMLAVSGSGMLTDGVPSLLQDTCSGGGPGCAVSSRLQTWLAWPWLCCCADAAADGCCCRLIRSTAWLTTAAQIGRVLVSASCTMLTTLSHDCICHN